MLHLLHLFEKRPHQTGLQEVAEDHQEAGEGHLVVSGDFLLADPSQEVAGPRCLVAWVPLLPGSCFIHIKKFDEI